MNLKEVITSIAMRISFGQTKEEIREDLRVESVGDTMFFWAWQAATYEPKNLVCCSPPLSRSFKAGCVAQTTTDQLNNPDVILYDHG